MDRKEVRAGALARLRTRIAEIEETALAARAQEGRAPALWPGLCAPTGVLHEARAEDWRDASAATGFALALAAGIAGGDGAIVIIERAHEAARDGGLCARGLCAFGIDPARALFIRPRKEEHALWAAEEAARAKGVAAALLILRERAARLTLTATRRLHLAAEESGATPIIMRRHDPSDLTAAAMRWRVEPRPSAPPAFDARSPGFPRWLVSVEKAARGASLSARRTFLVEWRHDQRRFVLPVADDRSEAGAAHSRALLSASFGRSSPAANEEGRRGAARAS